jgi:hypothetical protein
LVIKNNIETASIIDAANISLSSSSSREQIDDLMYEIKQQAKNTSLPLPTKQSLNAETSSDRSIRSRSTKDWQQWGFP